jgi:hypothetical protein
LRRHCAPAADRISNACGQDFRRRALWVTCRHSWAIRASGSSL